MCRCLWGPPRATLPTVSRSAETYKSACASVLLIGVWYSVVRDLRSIQPLANLLSRQPQHLKFFVTKLLLLCIIVAEFAGEINILSYCGIDLYVDLSSIIKGQTTIDKLPPI